MASIQALTAHLVPNHHLPTHPAPKTAGLGRVGAAALRQAPCSRVTAQDTYYIEDGWVFREHHGKYVECICRTEELPASTANNMLVFQLR